LGFDADPLIRKRGKRNETMIKLDTFFTKSNP